MINVDRRAARAALGAGWLAACGSIAGSLATDASDNAAPSSPTGPTVAAYDGEASYGDFGAAALGAGAASGLLLLAGAGGSVVTHRPRRAGAAR